MPRGDRTGPNGMGPMTGRAAGFCAGLEAPGFANPIAGRGQGQGFGGGFGGRGGRGRRNMFYATGMPGWMRDGSAVAPVQNVQAETQALQQQATMLQEQLDAITRRLAEVEMGNS